MYIHIGEDIIIDSKDIIYICDIDRNTVSKRSKKFLLDNDIEGKVFYVSFEELPRTMIVTCNEEGEEMVYISPLSLQLLLKRINENSIVGDSKCTYLKLF